MDVVGYGRGFLRTKITELNWSLTRQCHCCSLRSVRLQLTRKMKTSDDVIMFDTQNATRAYAVAQQGMSGTRHKIAGL